MGNSEKKFVDTRDIEKWCAPKKKDSKKNTDTLIPLMIALSIVMTACFIFAAFSLAFEYDVLFFICSFIGAFLGGIVFEKDNWR